MGSTPPRPGSTPPASGALPPTQVAGAALSAPAPIGKAGSTPVMPASGTPPTNVPLVSDEDLVKAACRKVCGSIFHVDFTPKNRANLESYINGLIAKLNLFGEKKDKWEKKMKAVVDDPSRSTTGFVVGENKGHLFILTCTHPMEACFAGGHPMTDASVRDLFKISVKCDHAELQHNPVPTEAVVYGVDTKKGMLLLRVRKSVFCTENHLVLEVAEKLPDGHLAAVGMVSWPRDRHRTIVLGSVCHGVRSLEDFDYDNEHGYDFKAIELNITSKAGSSGAPAVDKSAKVLGMLHGFGKLHGGNSDCISYFVPYDDITKMLKLWGINNKAGTVAPVAGTSSGGVKRKLGSAPAGAT